MSTPVVTNIDPAKVRRPIGKTQWFFLRCCREHGAYQEGGGWTWGGRAMSLRLAQGLVDRGLLSVELVQTRGAGRYVFKITPAGLECLTKSKWATPVTPAPENTKEHQP